MCVVGVFGAGTCVCGDEESAWRDGSVCRNARATSESIPPLAPDTEPSRGCLHSDRKTLTLGSTHTYMSTHARTHSHTQWL